MLSIGSLFSGGAGGLELGLEWAGLGPTVWQVEIEPLHRINLAAHWPGAQRHSDVRHVGRANLAPVDLICGGFPCADTSSAGKGAGLAGERSGLWYEFARVVGEMRPRWVVVENPASGGRRWVDAVVRGLVDLGYECLPVPLDARMFGARQRRKRVFVVARLADADRVRQRQPHGELAHERGLGDGATPGASDPDGERWTQGSEELQPEGRREFWAADASRRAAPDADGATVRLEPGRSGWPGRAAGEAIAGEAAADALRSGRQGHRPGAHEGWPGPTEDPWRVPGGRLVPLVHGVSAPMDAGARAGRLHRKLSQAQGGARRAAIRALGLCVMPQMAEIVGWVVRELAGLGTESPRAPGARGVEGW